MIKNTLKNKMYIVMILGTFISVVSFITCFFIENKTYFTSMFIVNVVINFLVTGFCLLVDDNNTKKFRCISLYLLTTLFFLLMGIIVINKTWDLMKYSTLMYVKNMQLYLGMYSVFVLVMTLLSLYAILKNNLISDKTSIRQNSSKR